MKGVEADAPVFIILGVLTVLVGFGVVFGIIGNFGGQSSPDNEDALGQLVNDIEQKCEDMEEYNTVVESTTEIEIISGEAQIGQNSVVHEESDINRDIECSRSIDYSKDGSKKSEITLEGGVYDITLGGEDGNVLVEVE